MSAVININSMCIELAETRLQTNSTIVPNQIYMSHRESQVTVIIFTQQTKQDIPWKTSTTTSIIAIFAITHLVVSGDQWWPGYLFSLWLLGLVLVGFLNQVHPISRGYLKLHPACSLSHCLSAQSARSQVSWLMWSVWCSSDDVQICCVLNLMSVAKNSLD